MGKCENSEYEEKRRHRFDDWGTGAVMTGRTDLGNTSTAFKQKAPTYNYARQMGIKRSFPKYEWSEVGCLVTQRRDDFAIQFTDRSSARGGYMSARGHHVPGQSTSRTGRSDQSESLDELEAKRARMQERLDEIEALLNGQG